ncbi:MAG: radical SAM protein [Dehalococcoidales bacterium]|jgi:radical SAM protein with 4Fe4S-binding SPASM domain
MLSKKPQIEVNANFHHIAGSDLYARADERFKEYRKRWKEWPESFHAGKFPLFIDVEVTSACNLKCPFCATTFRGNEIKKGFMAPDMLKKIIDEGRENGLYGVKFNIRGEPLLHPKIDEFVKYAKASGLVDVYFNTNAMLLTDRVANKLIDAGLDRISVSFEGYTKEMYESNRVGADYQTVLDNIENLQKLKKRLNVAFPKVRIQTVMLPDIKPIFDKYKEFWSGRVDEVAFLDYKEMKVKKKGVKYPWACPQIWQRMAIWWDGTILPCNHDDDGLLALGNVSEVSIGKAWQSEELNRIREVHKNGMAHEIGACDGCYLRASEIAKLTEA